MSNHDIAKRFWRLAIDHHSFFRLKQPIELERSFFSRFGSSRHRFSGRTYYQSTVYAASVQRLEPFFERASSQQLSRSLGGSFIDERSARKKVVQDFDGNDSRSGHYEQVAVVAGTGHEASRVAFVKTVRPGDIAEEPSFDHHNLSQGSGADLSRRFIQHSHETAVSVHQTSYTSNSDTSFSRSTAEAGALVLKQKTTVNVVTEHTSVKNGVVETKIERRQVIGREDLDHDGELSKAIHSAMDMSADLSVDKIEINPSDIAHSMVGKGEEQSINIAPTKTKKNKKRDKHAITAE